MPLETAKKSPSEGNSYSDITAPPSGSRLKPPNSGDRFIPLRSSTTLKLGNYKVNHKQQLNPGLTTPTQRELCRQLSEIIYGGDNQNMRIFSYQNKAPGAPNIHQPFNDVSKNSKRSFRQIPPSPETILDAPGITDDFYLNLMDWNQNNLMALALGNNVYISNTETNGTQLLLSLKYDLVCSVCWTQHGNYLAVGTHMGVTQLWDCNSMNRIRIMRGNSARVISLSWNSDILSSGCHTGHIFHHDVRQRCHIVAKLPCHMKQVCGLRWSPNGRLLASGGDDNMLHIWPAASGLGYPHPKPLFSFRHHAAVKALAWCPWKSSILASGSGLADGHIRFWNCESGCCLNTIDTQSQVSAVHWSTEHKELISGHGYPNNNLIIWKYPTTEMVTNLHGHKDRILQLAISPDGSTVVSVSANETLKLWKCSVPTATQKKKNTDFGSIATYYKLIR